tara:strand:+ start:270 stop:881 length:612 start_codon:yes stop_codon:yes gene_type:complete
MGENNGEGGRIGVFGGTFDPPHIAHIQIAQFLFDFACLKKVLWIPTFKSPHKSDREVAPADIRLKMVKAAISGLIGHEACDIEILRGGYSYTVDTLRSLKKIYTDENFLLMMGSDQFCKLPEWNQSESLRELVEICVFPRKGGIVSNEFASSTLGIDCMIAPFQELDISSSEIRKKVRKDLPFIHLVPESVGAIILQEGLYQS